MISIPIRWIVALTAILAGYASIVLLSGAGYNPLGISWNFSNNGAFGDAFGPISAIMASLAALSAIATFDSQSKEIERLKEREADSDARAEKLSFERAFFQLLDHHRQNLAQIDIDGAGGKRTGQDAFRSMLYYAETSSGSNIRDSWAQVYSKYQNDLGHYFRFLYHIINYVDKSGFKDRYFYIQIIRATLSESELILLGLNCVYGEGREKFKGLIERYALLHNISDGAKLKYRFEQDFESGAFDRSLV